VKHPYQDLTPDVVLDALSALGLPVDGRMSALSSYENRVYQVMLDDADPVVVKIDIEADATLRWNGQILADRQALETKLAEAAALQPQPELHIRSHAKAKYETTAAVLAGAQRAGLSKLGIVGTERFAN